MDIKNSPKHNQEYRGLKYKTKGDASPQGRPRVYFCCCEKDHSRLFQPITDEILEIQKTAAIWYYDPADGAPEGEQFLADLSRMQLFIVPVTSNFLFLDDPARTVEFQYAIEHHIPVLPLMQERGLEQVFNEICGELQFLDASAENNDPTVIPYKEKLKSFLESVLVSDELARKIRAAFDAYVFLSYRKKDRIYAQKIMRLIHENDFCRDVAIWYDEFLTPGENFNDAIKDALKKSVLFALVVTPSLLEVPNYVKSEEYPMAKGSGKTVLPVEALATDPEELARLYEGIDPALPPEQIAEHLRKSLLGIALRENDNDPAHNFLIGLAYLSGIDVEVDYSRALALIKSAAEAELPEALEKLVSMYKNGEGVAINHHISAEWQARYASCLEKAVKRDPSEDNYISLVNSFRYLGEAQIDLENIPAARQSFLSMLKFSEQMQEMKYDTAPRCVVVSNVLLGDLCREEKNYSEALNWYNKGLTLCEELIEETDLITSHNDRSVFFNRLGRICEEEEKFEEAIDWYKKDLVFSELLAEKTGTAEARRNLAACYTSLGDVSYDRGDFEEAEEWHMKALSIREKLAEETGSQNAYRDLSETYNILGEIYQEKGELSDALNWYHEDLAISMKLAKTSGTILDRRNLTANYLTLARISESLGKSFIAKELYLRSLSIFVELADETGKITDLDSLGITYYKLLKFDDIPIEERKDYLKQFFAISQKLYETTGQQRYESFLAEAEKAKAKLKNEKDRT